MPPRCQPVAMEAKVVALYVGSGYQPPQLYGTESFLGRVQGPLAHSKFYKCGVLPGTLNFYSRFPSNLLPIPGPPLRTEGYSALRQGRGMQASFTQDSRIQSVFLTSIECGAHRLHWHAAGRGKHIPTDQYLEGTGPAV